ncbi:hypothetical protein [Secundilactobacillus yichangensis]|uniref:hypothetical protein n=1 Tax=Secundilactobacillus yichangensis TaxID=2799580 RepID=UPI0019453A9B|nr:hypothetical protein [Secundilactobacillus yichangensis]
MKSLIKFVGILILSLGAFLGVTTVQEPNTTTAHATTWHKGSPQHIHGSYHTKTFYTHGHKDQMYFFISNSGASVIEKDSNGPGVQNGLSYHSLGKGKYTLRMHYRAGGYGYYTIKISNKGKKVYVYKMLGKTFYKVSNKLAVY